MIAARLLLVEDDPELAEIISSFLTSAGYAISCVHSGREALLRLQEVQPELLLLDLGLPEVHGLTVLREVQLHYPRCKVCIVTALTDIASKEAAFRGGCDDYITKPFHTKELGLRVEALLRRGKHQRSLALVFGDTCILRDSPVVQRAGLRVKLTPKEHALLVYLAERSGEVVSRGELLDDVWNGADRYPNTVDAHIESLRKKFDIPFGRKSIRTSYGQGYFFEP
jgi:two-component system, OmpR family, response regulator